MPLLELAYHRFRHHRDDSAGDTCGGYHLPERETITDEYLRFHRLVYRSDGDADEQRP